MTAAKNQAQPAIETKAPCPKCGLQTQLIPVDPGLRLRIAEEKSPSYEQLCTNCHKRVSKKVSQSAQLKAREVASNNAKNILWQGRIQLFKTARAHGERSEFSQAAVHYEKYIKIIESSYKTNFNDLTPELFHDRPKEITVISSALWELLKIYDSNSKYTARQNEVAIQLSKFLRYSPLFPVIVRKAEITSRKAKNPRAFKTFLKLSDAERPRCFIATAAFESGNNPHVLNLRAFRDLYLKQHPAGRAFILGYYKYSPKIASWMIKHPRSRGPIRCLLRPVAFLAKKTLYLKN